MNPIATKVLLVGWDAADWRVIDPLLSQGKMPNLARFLQAGVRGNISTLYPVLSPMLWMSIATGKRPYKHGVHGFSEPTPDGRAIRPVTNLSRKTKALWNMLHQNGKTSNIVGWWPSHPAEPIRGVMVSNHYQQAPGPIDKPWPMLPGTVHPQRLAKALQEFRLHPCELDESHIGPFVPRFADIDQDHDHRLEAIAKVLAEISSIHGAATALMQLEPWDFMAVYYDGIDHFGHGFMKYHPPRQHWIGEKDFELYRGVIEAAYRYHDMMLGTLLALAGEETTVILMSDHGFHPDQNRPSRIPAEPAGPAAEHRHFGILAMKGPGIRSGERIYGASVLDVCPTILRLFGLPAGGDMDGKVLVTAFQKIPKIETIPSWDDVAGDAGCHPPEAQIDSVQSAEVLKQMVELGYIEPLPEDHEKAVRQTVRELRVNLAASYMDGGMLQKAAEILRVLWADWPEEHRLGIQLAGCLAGMRQVDERREVLERLEQNMQRFAASARIELESCQGPDFDPEALSEAEKYRIRRLAHLASPDTGMLAYLRGLQRTLEGRDAEAVAELEAGVALAPSSPALLVRLGYALLKTSAFERARQSFAAALAADADQVEAHLGIALVQEATEDWDGMLAAALNATELVFHNPRGHSAVGRALVELGRYDQAEQAFQLALHQAPRHAEAVAGLRRLHGELRPDAFKLKSLDLGQYVAREQVKARGRQQAGRRKAATAPWPDPLQVVTIVSGLPRSGTSMMMQMLAAGGLAPYTDGGRAADEDNPRGYFEHDVATRLASNHAWLPETRGKAVKIVAPLLPRLPADERYQVIMMRRHLEEVAASQRQMLKRLGRPGAALQGDELISALRHQLLLVDRWTSGRPNVRLLDVEFAEALADPPGVSERIAAFLGLPLDVKAMAAAVDPSLRRRRAAV